MGTIGGLNLCATLSEGTAIWLLSSCHAQGSVRSVHSWPWTDANGRLHMCATGLSDHTRAAHEPTFEMPGFASQPPSFLSDDLRKPTAYCLHSRDPALVISTSYRSQSTFPVMTLFCTAIISDLSFLGTDMPNPPWQDAADVVEPR
jgi:hypothetical protein